MNSKICDNPECFISTNNKRFCSKSCSAKTTNVEVPRRIKIEKFCLNCNKIIRGKFCNINCQWNYQRKLKIEKWQAGLIDGSTMMSMIKNYFRQIHNNKCQKCSWNEIHPITGKVPLELDHIDGDWTNNTFENFQLICPNCHSLTVTSGALNSNANRNKFGYKEIPISRREAGKM